MAHHRTDPLLGVSGMETLTKVSGWIFIRTCVPQSPAAEPLGSPPPATVPGTGHERDTGQERQVAGIQQRVSCVLWSRPVDIKKEQSGEIL